MGCEGSIERRRDQKPKRPRNKKLHHRAGANPGETFWGNDDVGKVYQTPHAKVQLLQAHITLNLVPANHKPANPLAHDSYLAYCVHHGAGGAKEDYPVHPSSTVNIADYQRQLSQIDREEEGEESYGDTMPGEECAEHSEDIPSIQPHYHMSTISEHCPLPPLTFTLVYE